MSKDIIISYHAYLSEKRYASGTIDAALRMAKRLNKTFSKEELLSRDNFDILNELGVKPSTTTSKHWYRYHIKLYQQFLEKQEAYIL